MNIQTYKHIYLPTDVVLCRSLSQAKEAFRTIKSQPKFAELDGIKNVEVLVQEYAGKSLFIIYGYIPISLYLFIIVISVNVEYCIR